MSITTAVILLLAILLAPILLIRYRKRWVAAFNLAVTNRITSRFAARLPGFGILTHVGRKSGKLYRTPVNVFRAPEGFLIALTYGRESEWVRMCWRLADASLRLGARGIYFLHQPSCTIPLGDGSRFLCGWSSDSLVLTISCSFRFLALYKVVRPSSDRLRFSHCLSCVTFVMSPACFRSQNRPPLSPRLKLRGEESLMLQSFSIFG